MPEIKAITTGTVRIKRDMRRGRTPARRLRLFTPGAWTDALPIHAWLIEHADGLLLIDTGERADIGDPPFAKFDVQPADQIDSQLMALGVDWEDLGGIALTHVHSDHANGLFVLPGIPVMVSLRELVAVHAPMGRMERTVLKQPLAPGFAPGSIKFDDGPIGAFDASHKMTPDGKVRAVPTPGHTAGHTSYLIDEGDHDVLIAGDTSYDQQQLLDRHADGVSPRASVARNTMLRILAHAALRPTVYLPSHDPQSAERLAQRTIIPVPKAP
jgi:N-acyl homoserine lactone hydrolase